MRILFALNTFRPYIDGVGVSIERQAIGLASRGHQIAIVAPSERLTSYVESTPAYRVYRVRAVSVAGQHRRVPLLPGRGVARALHDFRPDAVVVSLPFLLSRATWHAARDRGYPLVGITSMMPEWFFYNLGTLRPFARLLRDGLWRLITDYYNRCDHVVGVTETALGFLLRHGLRQPASVISNGVPLDLFHPRPRDGRLAARWRLPDKPTVLYTGRLDAEKCMAVWIRAIPRVRERIDAHFVVGGDGGERRALESLASHLGVSQAVSFVGFQPDADYPHLFSLADVFAITSPAELQSVVTLEAAASGLPIVAARAGALPELVREGTNGHLFPVGDVDQLASAIVDVLSNEGRRRAMGTASRQIAAEHSLERTLDRFEWLYQEVVDLRASRPSDTTSPFRGARWREGLGGRSQARAALARSSTPSAQ